MSIRQRFLHSARAFVCSQALNAVIQLLGFPVFLTMLGPEVNGEWIMLSAFVSAFAMSDVGIASATGNAMSVAAGSQEYAAARKSYESGWLLVSVLSSVALVGVLLLIWSSPFIDWLGLRSSSSAIIRWTVTALIVQTLVGLQTSILFASLRSAGHLAKTINIGTMQRLCEFFAHISAVYFFQSVLAVALAGLGVRLIEFGVTWITQKRTIEWLRSSWATMEWRLDPALFRPAFASLSIPLGNLLSNQAVLLVIGNVLGPASVNIFTAHRTLANIALQVVQSIGYSMQPEFSFAFGAGDQNLAKRLHRKACQLSLGLGLLFCLLVGLTAPAILQFWLHGRIAHDPLLMMALLLWVATRSLWYTSFFVPMSINLHHRIAIALIMGLGMSLVLAVPLTQSAGLFGTAISMLFTEIGMSFIVLRTSIRLVGDSPSAFWRSITRYGS